MSMASTLDWRAVVEEAVLGDDGRERAAFLAKHRTKVGPILSDLIRYYQEFNGRQPTWPGNERTVVTGQFLLAVGNTIASSAHLLVSGFAVPAGQLMRQHAEAFAMALMCATPACRVFEAYSAAPSTYPIHKAIDRLKQKATGIAIEGHLRISRAAWQGFAETSSFLDEFSHTSVVAMGHHVRFGAKSGGIVVGAVYDPNKFKQYRKQLQHLRSASRNLEFLLLRIEDGLRRAAV